MESESFNENTVVLVVYDIHLGASGANHDAFINFLKKLSSKKKNGNLIYGCKFKEYKIFETY